MKVQVAVMALAGVAALAVGGCAQMPAGPTVAVWPARGKPMSVFRQDDAQCRAYARARVDPDAANNQAVQQVAVSAAVGALAGALIANDDDDDGAAIGAGVGILTASSNGSDATARANWTLQRQFNVAYEQCMYSKGNQIPGTPRPAYTPPPPPGTGH